MPVAKRMIAWAVAFVALLLLFAFAVFWLPHDSIEYARQVRVEADLKSLETQLDAYKQLNGFYPTTEQGLNALVTKPQSSPIPSRWTQHFGHLPLDAWQRSYVYRCPSSKDARAFDLYSLGPDGIESNDDLHLAP